MNTNPATFIALLPLFILAATIIAVIGWVSYKRQHFVAATITVVGLNAALLSLLAVIQVTPVDVTPLFVFDNFSVLYIALILISTLACATLSHAYLAGFSERREEFYILLLCGALGAVTLAISRHLASFFIGLELLSVPLYGMAAYAFKVRISLESGIKYMILSAATSAFMLFGFALLYSATGHLDFAGLGQSVGMVQAHHKWLIAGIGMVVVALGFKLSLVPFHMWTPDVYEGAPAPASTFLATVSKLAVFALLIRLFQIAPISAGSQLHYAIEAIALASMLVGNLLALRQNNIKRLLGYSAIGHLGYLLTVIVVSNDLAVEAAGVYLTVYVLTTLGAFGVVTLVSSPFGGQDAASLHHYRGLFWRRPFLAAMLTVMMLSLAGVPLTAGFIGKLYVFIVAVQANLWWLVGGIFVGSGIGLYYYLRVIATLYMREPGETKRDAPRDWGRRSGGLMVLLVSTLVILIGLYPQPLIYLVKLATLASGQ